MNTARASRALGLLALAAVVSPYALADNAGWYGGINAGQSRSTIDDAGITKGLSGGGFTTTAIVDDNRDSGYKLFGGYQFNRNIALEAGFFNLGEFGFVASTIPAGTLNGRLKLNGLNLDLVGTLPITEKFSAFGRIGATYTDARDSFSGTGLLRVANPNPSKHDTNYKYGLGLQYAFNDTLALRGEAERYRINDAVGSKGDIDLLSLGLIFRFGGKSPTPAARAPAPVYAAATPEPAPVAKAAPPPPPPPPAPVPAAAPRFEKFTISATELLFAFNSAELRMPQPKLDEVANALNGNKEVGNIVITGYTDRIGSTTYNQTLSEKRAASVKDYLSGKGVDANRLNAQGKGEADPLVTCTEKKRSALINCLEPNRRVDIEQITLERRVR